MVGGGGGGGFAVLGPATPVMDGTGPLLVIIWFRHTTRTTCRNSRASIGWKPGMLCLLGFSFWFCRNDKTLCLCTGRNPSCSTPFFPFVCARDETCVHPKNLDTKFNLKTVGIDASPRRRTQVGPQSPIGGGCLGNLWVPWAGPDPFAFPTLRNDP